MRQDVIEFIEMVLSQDEINSVLRHRECYHNQRLETALVDCIKHY